MNYRDKSIIGVDEVGMGSLAGPVVACAVAIPQNIHKKLKIGNHGVRDSKLMTPKQRETCAEKIKKLNIKYKMSFCYPKTIDRINIYQASRKAMRRAVLLLSPPALPAGKPSPSYGKRGTEGAIVLVDGKYEIPNLNFPQHAIIHGDRKIFAIACASIIAKVYRDNMMKRYHKRFPKYGFNHHKGYGTKMHYAMLVSHGPSPIHRKSFRLVTKYA